MHSGRNAFPGFGDASADRRTVGANLAELDTRMDLLYEQKLAHIRELAHLVIAEANTEDFVGSLLPSLADSEEESTEPTTEAVVNRLELRRISEYLTTADRTAFCRALREEARVRYSPEPTLFFGAQEILPADARKKVAYLRSTYTDDAFLLFSRALGDGEAGQARAVYEQTFSGVCEAVYNRLCEYCILPIENSADGKMMSFYSLIDKYELKITAVCDVEYADGSKITRFALLCRGAREQHFPGESGQYFEFALTAERYPTVSDLLAAARYCGLSFVRTDSVPVSYQYHEYMHYIVLDAQDADVVSFLIFLTVYAPQYSPVGLFSKI